MYCVDLGHHRQISYVPQALLFNDLQMSMNVHQANEIRAKTEEHVWILSADLNVNARLNGWVTCATKVRFHHLVLSVLSKLIGLIS